MQIIASPAQNLSGQWKGVLTQSGKADTFYYEINISHKDQSITGTSYSRTPGGRDSARFVITGFWDGKQLVLQELEQILPKNGGWCLKYLTLQWSNNGDLEWLKGNWKADRCTPGNILLSRQSTFKETILEKEEPFTWEGRWTGHLSQSDRDYGFFYELNLDANSEGQSNIVSEDNGGSAHHSLEWSFNTQDSILTIKELEVINKTDPKWKWCIKSARLKLRREGSRFILEGNWEGYIEGHTPTTGRCAPGTVYLEKPVVTQQFRQLEAQNAVNYETQEHREVRISRVVEVKRPNVRIQVWDSGTVDGDVVTLFLNGERILSRHRVSKNKLGIPVTLKADNNFLILHAEDLGDIPPNTVAVSVDDGTKEQVIVLSSDLKLSGAILIRQFKIE